MHSEAKTSWDPAFVARIQGVLDTSAAKATPVLANTFSRDDWRLNAESFLDSWNDVRMCIVGSASKDGKPHLAAIHANFTDDGRLTMRMFEESVRQKDFAENPRVALSKVTPTGGVMTVYGKPREVEGTLMPSRSGVGPGTVEVEIDINRIYAMQPAQSRTG
jgi:predicted pyridoxine 5'-phosphate oxidase superfamily flavin-nucleotide-binding protein